MFIVRLEYSTRQCLVNNTYLIFMMFGRSRTCKKNSLWWPCQACVFAKHLKKSTLNFRVFSVKTSDIYLFCYQFSIQSHTLHENFLFSRYWLMYFKWGIREYIYGQILVLAKVRTNFWSQNYWNARDILRCPLKTPKIMLLKNTKIPIIKNFWL